MPIHYKVDYFTDKNGFCPVKDYIRKIGSPKGQRIAWGVIEYLENVGPELIGTDMDKYIDDQLRELRKDRHRILYAQINKGYVLLLAFLKKGKNTPPKYIAIAHEQLNDYKIEKRIK
jgi:phage-related protein